MTNAAEDRAGRRGPPVLPLAGRRWQTPINRPTGCVITGDSALRSHAAGGGRRTVPASARGHWSAELRPSADRPFAELLVGLSERTPAPGAGSAIAWSAALAAGLLEMVASFAGAEAAAARGTRLRAELLDAGERELQAYEPVLSATSEEERRAALSAASETPLAIARAAAEVAELTAEVAAASRRSLQGDAIAGVLLAEAATCAAARLVEINLAGAPGDARLGEVAGLSERAARAREAAVGAPRHR